MVYGLITKLILFNKALNWEHKIIKFIKISVFLLLFSILFFTNQTITYAKIPFSTLYLEIVKDRYDGELKHLKKIKKYRDKVEKNSAIQYVWVEISTDSYLMIEQPGKNNELTEKVGRLKYQGKQYNLDFDMMVAWDETKSNKVFDNYTSKEADYQYYGSSKFSKKQIKTKDGIKRKAHKYKYSIENKVDSEATDLYIEEIMSSDMPNEDKEIEVARLKKALADKATKIIEWIWVDEGDEMGMFIRKKEMGANVLLEYNVLKIVPNDEFDLSIFEKTLAKFKIKIPKDAKKN